MKLIEYSEAPAEVKPRLIKLTRDSGDYSDKYTDSINVAIHRAARGEQYATKYDGFVYYIDKPTRKNKKRVLYFDYLGFEREEAKKRVDNNSNTFSLFRVLRN